MRVLDAPDATFTAWAAGDPTADGIHAMTMPCYTVFGSPCAGLVLHEAAFSDESGWRVSDSDTGCAITSLFSDPDAALRALADIAEKWGARFAGEVQRRRALVLAERTKEYHIEPATWEPIP